MLNLQTPFGEQKSRDVSFAAGLMDAISRPSFLSSCDYFGEIVALQDRPSSHEMREDSC
jgi:hypothetical protein